MKQIHYLSLLFLLLFATNSFSEIKREAPPELKLKISEKMNKTTTDEILQNSKLLHSRIPNFVNKLHLPKINSNQIHSNKNKSVNSQIQVSDDILQNAIFPGEFDEVKAIMITWPYFTFDSTGEYTDQLFDGLGVYYDQTTNDYFIGPVYSMIDTSAVSPFPVIFSQLAWGINQNTQVWINVWYPEDTTNVLNYMNKMGMPLTNYKFFIHPGNSFWYRDCGPMAFYYGNNDDLAFLDMEYYGGRPLDDSIPQLIASDMNIPLVKTSIEYEGGNVLLDGQKNLFTSNAVYGNNMDSYGQYYINDSGAVVETVKTGLTKQQINDSLMRILNLNSLKVLPSLRYDGGTGHVDLYADMWDENNFIFTKFPDALSSLTDYSISKKNIDTILSIVRTDDSKYRSENIPLPKKDNGSWYTSNDDYQNYTRTYSNHTFVNKSIIQPVFSDGQTGDITGMNQDLDSIQAKYPGYTIIPIDVRAFDGFGGAIHCITKQIPADNPIRIIHNPIGKWIKTQSEYDITAKITNKSGIADAVLYYRQKGEVNWNNISLTTQSENLFVGQIPNSLSDGSIEYYIKATSNNGKTMTKPITAPAGYYTFNFNNGVSVKENILSNSGSFYPNPAINETRIILGNLNGSVSVHIFNSLGSIIYSENLKSIGKYDELKLNTSGFPNGIYFVNFINENGSVITRSFVVSK